LIIFTLEAFFPGQPVPLQEKGVRALLPPHASPSQEKTLLFSLEKIHLYERGKVLTLVGPATLHPLCTSRRHVYYLLEVSYLAPDPLALTCQARKVGKASIVHSI
jgi:hypothetical protein